MCCNHIAESLPAASNDVSCQFIHPDLQSKWLRPCCAWLGLSKWPRCEERHAQNTEKAIQPSRQRQGYDEWWVLQTLLLYCLDHQLVSAYIQPYSGSFSLLLGLLFHLPAEWPRSYSNILHELVWGNSCRNTMVGREHFALSQDNNSEVSCSIGLALTGCSERWTTFKTTARFWKLFVFSAFYLFIHFVCMRELALFICLAPKKGTLSKLRPL